LLLSAREYFRQLGYSQRDSSFNCSTRSKVYMFLEIFLVISYTFTRRIYVNNKTVTGRGCLLYL
jgi:hypothetical protein